VFFLTTQIEAQLSQESCSFEQLLEMYKSSLLGLLLWHVTKQSEVCHWIVSANGGNQNGKSVLRLMITAVDSGPIQVALHESMIGRTFCAIHSISIACARTRGAHLCRAEPQDNGRPR
jgi:hypothetical protein